MQPTPDAPVGPPGAPPPHDPLASDWVVRARSLGKRFDIYRDDRGRLLELFSDRSHHDEHWALRGVDFEVSRGRSFGVIGPNGAGKSTLLKLIAGISKPSEGELLVQASLTTLLDLGLGFHNSFTGRENIRLNCSLLGMSDAQITARSDDIVRFADLGPFIDYPVRTYSSGMNLRLGFAIAAHADSEVFLVDEVLAVGDQAFQRRCVRKIEEFLADGKTIILVTHDLHAVRSLCDEALWLEGGQVRLRGPSRDVVERYVDQERQRNPGPQRALTRPIARAPLPVVAPGSTDTDPTLVAAVLAATRLPDSLATWDDTPDAAAPELTHGDVPVIQGTGEVRILSVQVLDRAGVVRDRFRTGDDLVVAVTFRTTERVARPIFGVAIFRNDGTYVHGPNTRYDGVLDGDYDGIYTFWVRWTALPLLAGSYRLSVAVFDQAHLKPHVWHNQLYEFEVGGEVEDHGLVRLEHAWGLISHLEAER